MHHTMGQLMGNSSDTGHGGSVTNQAPKMHERRISFLIQCAGKCPLTLESTIISLIYLTVYGKNISGLLSQGLDVKVSLSGKDKTTLKMKYVLFSRPLIYKLTNESDFLENLRKKGFKKVIFSDGFEYT